MRWLESRILWGSLLILGGVIFLLQNLGILSVGELFWAIVFGFAGVIFFSIFIQNRLNWWAVIPSLTFLGIALSIALEWILPEFGETWSRSIVLAGIGLSFVAIYLIDQQNWWAVIPAGVLFTLAVVAGIEKRQPSFSLDWDSLLV